MLHINIKKTYSTLTTIIYYYFFIIFIQVIKGERKVTLVLDDPCGNSYLQVCSQLHFNVFMFVLVQSYKLLNVHNLIHFIFVIYLQSICYPEPDKKLIVEKYERTIEQNEELGLLDMKVENYEASQLWFKILKLFLIKC